MNAVDSPVVIQPLTQLSEEESQFQQSVREWADQRLRPYVRSMDEAEELQLVLLDELFALGIMAIDVAEEYGGQGGTFFQSILAIEELARVDPAISVIVDVQNTLINNAISRYGSDAQKLRYLPRLSRDFLGAYALSETGSGSDAFALTTRAVPAEDGWTLHGRKLWITNAVQAKLFLVFATLDPAAGHRGVTCFLVDRETPGLTVGRKEQKLGIRASSTCELILDGVAVRPSQLLGEAGRGYKVAIETLNEGRIGIGAQMLGLAEGALEHARRYVLQRKQFGKTLAEFQAVQFQIADMATRVEAARLLVYNAGRLRDAGLPFITEAAMAKHFASQIAEETASAAVELFGGYGFSRDYPVEKLYRDAKIGRIYEGTANMQRHTIAKALLNR